MSSTRCRRCTIVYDVEKVPASTTCGEELYIEVALQPWMTSVVCGRCLMFFAKRFHRQEQIIFQKQWLRDNPFMEALNHTLEDAMTQELRDDNEQEFDEQRYDDLRNLHRRIKPPPIKELRDPTYDDFNEWLFIGYNRLIARLDRGKPMERCRALNTVGKRCLSWADHDLGDGYVLCRTHLDEYQRRRPFRRGLQIVRDPETVTPLHYFAFAATSAEDAKRELIKAMPHEWLIEMGIGE